MYIKVRVATRIRKELFTKISGDSFLVSVKEPALQNRANTRVRELIANHFGILSKQARIVSGHHSPNKILSIPEEKEGGVRNIEY